MNPRITWVDLSTGKRGVFQPEWGRLPVTWDADNQAWNFFVWQEGNFGCDCNRRILFLGEKSEEVDCGKDRMHILKFEVLGQDGTVLFTKEPFERHPDGEWWDRVAFDVSS